MIEIKRWDTGAVIFKSETAATIAEALKEGVQNGCSFFAADLRSANLSSADLRYADLSSANLSSANLRSADLRYADLRYADLRYANLSSADLRYADLSSATNSALAIAMTRILPSEGEVIGWKKCQQKVLVKVRIPPEAQRCHAFGRKCRAEFVEVLEVVGAEVALSIHDNGKTVYRTGERVACDKWEPDFTQECAGGIHFFITKEEAAFYGD